MKSKLPIATYEQVVAALFCLGWLASMVVAAHRPAFFVHPFDVTDMVRRTELIFFIAGWILLCGGPIAIAVRMLLVDDAPLRYLWFVSLLYPASVIAIQVTLYVQNNRWYFDYLQKNPWFAVTDIIVPIGLLLVDRVVRNSRISVAETASESELTPYLMS